MGPPSSTDATDDGANAISPDQCRAARGFLGWSLEETAQRSGVNRNTIHNFESGKRAPHPGTITALRACFEAAGLRFAANAVEETVARRRS